MCIDLRNAGSSQNAEPDSIAAFWRGGRVEAAPETANHGHVGSLGVDKMVFSVEAIQKLNELEGFVAALV